MRAPPGGVGGRNGALPEKRRQPLPPAPVDPRLAGACPQGGCRDGGGNQRETARSCISTCTPSTPCWTAPPGSRTCSPQCQRTGMPAVAMTDHGNVYGAYDFWSQGDRGRDQADHRHRGLRRARAPQAPAAGRAGDPGAEGRRRVRRRRLHAHDAARRDHRGHAQPVPPRPRWPRWRATSASPGWTGNCSRRTPRGSSPPPAARPARSRPGSGSARSAEALRGGRRPTATSSAPGNFFVEIMDHGLRDRAAGPGRPAPDREGAVAAVRGHQRLALHPAGRRDRARGAAVRADRHQPGRPRPVQVRRHRLLPQEPAGDAGRELRRGMAGRLRLHPARSPSGPTSASPRRT